MAGNLFKQAAAYRKKHPSVSQTEAVKIVARQNKKSPAKKKAAGKKKAAVGKVRRKKAAPKKKAAKKAAAPRKVKVKLKTGKKGITSMSITGVHMSKISHEHTHQKGLANMIDNLGKKLKISGLSAAEKNKIRADVKKCRESIGASKKHVSAMKRFI